MQKNNSSIHTNVMRRVRTIHAVRPLASGTAFAALLALGSLYAIGREVWVAQVFANMPNPAHLAQVFVFFEAAFFNTTAVVQILCVAVLFAFAWIVRDFARSVQLPRFA